MSIKSSNWLFGIVMIIIVMVSVLFASCEKDNLTVDGPDVIMDIDGNVYHSVIIGDQEWMVENLKVTRLNDGTRIKLISSNNEWKNEWEPSYCWYNNIVNINGNEGLLYNFACVNTDKLAPKGWHIPSDDEWKELEMFIGIDEQEVDKQGWRGDGYPIILCSVYWYGNINYSECDQYGFSALSSGGRNGWFGDFIMGAYWWTSSQYDADDTPETWMRAICEDNNLGIGRANCINSAGLSVRCVKNK